MKRHRVIPLLGALLLTGAAAGTAGAQASSGDSVAAADELPGDTAEKKGGGLMGKVKGIAKNKVVQQVAKTAACTMVPGGQAIVGAIDAASSKDAGGVARGAAGAATGTSCMPGMGGAGAAGAAALGAGSMPGGGMIGGAGDAQTMAAMQQMMQAQMAQGALTPEGASAGNAQMAAAMQMMQAQMARAGAGMPAGMPPGAAGMPGLPTAGAEAGKPLEVSSDLAGDLEKGKTVFRHIDWIPGGDTVSPAGAEAFTGAMARLAAAMKQAGGSYRLDLYMDKESGDVVVRKLGPKRLAVVRASLIEGGDSAGAKGPQIGASKKDEDPRLEIVRVK